MSYIYKNRTHYVRQQATEDNKSSWKSIVINRQIIWSITPQNQLSYKIIGERINNNDLIVDRDKYKITEIFNGQKTLSSVNNLETLLMTLADAWAAKVVLPNEQCYNGFSGVSETPETPREITENISEGKIYPYF
jgi:hypothetical protein